MTYLMNANVITALSFVSIYIHTLLLYSHMLYSFIVKTYCCYIFSTSWFSFFLFLDSLLGNDMSLFGHHQYQFLDREILDLHQ